MFKKLWTIPVLFCFAFVQTSGCTSKESDDRKVDGEQQKLDQTKPTTPTHVEVKNEMQLDVESEVEPNDTTPQAMEINKSTVINAELDTSSKPKKPAKDWYKIVTTSKQVVKVEVSGVDHNDLCLTFLDTDKNHLFTVDSASEGEGETMPNLTVEGSAYVSVSSLKDTQPGSYQLAITMTEPATNEERESNDRYSLANSIQLGSEMHGYLGHRKDQDWYLVDIKDLHKDSVLRIEVTGVDGVRLELGVLDHIRRAPIIKVRSNTAGDGLVIRNMGIPEGNQAVYLAITSAWVPAQNSKKYIQTFNTTLRYALSISSETGETGLEREPNDDANQAIGLVDGQAVHGYLSHADDTDWYRIDVERTSLLSAKLSALDRVDLQLYVVDPARKDEKKDFALVRINDGLVNEEEVLTNCLLEPGENYLRVEGAWKKVDGKWVRDFVNLEDTYSLTIHLKADDGTEEHEPNNQPDQATNIILKSALHGTLHPSGDKDMYKLDLSSMEGPRNTLIQCTGITKLDISLTLLEPDGIDQEKLKVITKSDSGKESALEEIQRELLPGNYFVLVRGKPYTESNPIDQYILTITQP